MSANELFHNIRLPKEVEKGAHGGAMFNTTVTQLSSGDEARNINWSADLQEWDIGYGIQTEVDFYIARAFFKARRGRGYGFRFKDWSDFNVPDVASGLVYETIGLGDGANKDFQSVKTYEPSGPLPYVRTLTRLVDGAYVDSDTGSNVTNTIKIYLNGVLQSSGFTVSTTGLIHFTSAPGMNVIVGLAAEFDIPSRFNVDKFDLSLALFNAGTIQSLPIIEIRDH